MWMANVTKKNGWPMLLRYAKSNAFNISGAHNEFTKWGWRPEGGPIRRGAARGRPHYVPR